jgi:hypothetical protein
MLIRNNILKQCLLIRNLPKNQSAYMLSPNVQVSSYKSRILVKIHDATVHDGCRIIHHDYPPPSATSVLVLCWAVSGNNKATKQANIYVHPTDILSNNTLKIFIGSSSTSCLGCSYDCQLHGCLLRLHYRKPKHG